jgi:hypothetical protein
VQGQACVVRTAYVYVHRTGTQPAGAGWCGRVPARATSAVRAACLARSSGLSGGNPSSRFRQKKTYLHTMKSAYRISKRFTL